MKRAALGVLFAPALLALALAACDDRVPTRTTTVDPGAPRAVDLGTGPYRPRRRMDVDQLDASIRRATGGVGWDDSSGRNQFVRYSETLGVPDWLTSTTEDLDSSALFVKFLDDAARSVCTRLVHTEATSTATEHAFLVHADADAMLPADADAIDENLAYLLLRFHGRRVEMGSPELQPWHELFADARAAATSGEIAWTTVCVALIDHPDFYTY